MPKTRMWQMGYSAGLKADLNEKANCPYSIEDADDAQEWWCGFDSAVSDRLS